MAKAAKKADPAAPLQQILDELEQVTDSLAQRMLERYLATIPSYRALPDETLRQILEVNLANIRGFIAAVRAGRGPAPDELATIRESASRRAREGVPLSALLAAYRSGAQLTWSEARELMGDEPARLRAGLDFADAVMRWVDEASGAAAQAYLSEYERLTSDREAARRDFLDGTLSGDLTSDEIHARAEALGLDPALPHAVALLSVVEASDEDALLRGALHRLRGMAADLPHSERSLMVARGHEVVLIFPAPDGGEDLLATRLRSFIESASSAFGATLRGGVGRARDSFDEVAGSYREASIALTAARAGSAGAVAVYGEVLIEELLLRERGVARRLSQAILSPLDEHPDLLATLVEYIAHGPSLPVVARRLFLHPNTVAYRLARVRELTGRDPKTPAGVAELFLALRAAQLVRDDHS